jgi:hypothetical protein
VTIGAVLIVATLGATTLGAGALVGDFTEVDPATPGGLVFGQDVNDLGQVVGSADFAGGRRGFVRALDGTYTELEPLAGDSFSYASAINEGGDVVGGSDGHAVLWEAGGAPLDLGSLPGEASAQAVDINDSGWIVGNGSDLSEAWYRDPDVGTVAEIVPVPGGTITQVRAINNAGVAVGRVFVGGVPQPFTWNVDDGMTLLPLPPGETDFEPLDINGAGQIAGRTFEFIAPDGFYRAYVLDPDDSYQQLTMDGFDSAFPMQLSDNGLVVGFVDNPDDPSRTPAAWDLSSGDATAFPLFNEAAFTNELNAVNSSGFAVGISREGDDFERTYVGAISADPTTPPTPPATAPPAQPAAAAPDFTG